jgi:hypothetical protein
MTLLRTSLIFYFTGRRHMIGYPVGNPAGYTCHFVPQVAILSSIAIWQSERVPLAILLLDHNNHITIFWIKQNGVAV